MRTCSLTHDGTAYKFTGVKKCIDRKLLPKWCNVVLDEAYMCTNQELSPLKGKSLSVEKDAFNYYISLHRQFFSLLFLYVVNKLNSILFSYCPVRSLFVLRKYYMSFKRFTTLITTHISESVFW